MPRDDNALGVKFFTPDQQAQEKSPRIESPRGGLILASCRSGAYLAGRVAEQYQARLAQAGCEGQPFHLDRLDYQFSDSETCVRLKQDVNGQDVFLFQALYDPTSKRSVDENYMAFLIAARTLKEWGANHVTAILPYLAYARQDKPTRFEREPTTAKLLADFSRSAGVERLAVWHPHQNQIHGFYGPTPVDVLEAVGLFTAQFESYAGREEVIVVAPDAGASKFITSLSRTLRLKSAIASKYRPRPEETSVAEVIGDFGGKRTALVLDDMISTGGTVYALIKKLVEEKGIEAVRLGVSHNLCTEQAYERLVELHQEYHLEQIVVTNSIPQTEKFRELPFLEVRDLTAVLTHVINRIHHNRSVSELFEEQINN